MLLPEPSAIQFRAAAFALAIIAALTAAVIAVTWLDRLNGPPLIPLVVAYSLFNVGYIFSIVRGHLQTKGARLGLGAVLLNLLAMPLGDFVAIWTALSACAVAAALVGAYLLFRDASSAAA